MTVTFAKHPLHSALMRAKRSGVGRSDCHLISDEVSSHKDIMYNNDMTKQPPRKRLSTIFLILGMAFLAVGLATDQTAFTWIAIAFVLIALVTGGRWLRPRK
jgi:hypothetical protein